MHGKVPHFEIFPESLPQLVRLLGCIRENLKKALSLPDKSDPNPFAPEWGRADAYLYLVKYYKYEKKITDAKKYLEDGLKLYPNFELLQKMKAKLE